MLNFLAMAKKFNTQRLLKFFIIFIIARDLFELQSY
jgi:hypothetical protein